ncbi:MAG: P-II family nitrogen regulator [Halothiobacillaceae bacterium]
MKPIKRIEIVIAEEQAERLLHSLEEIPLSGYTIIKDVSGRGDRGERSEEGLGLFSNHYILIACPESDVEAIIDKLRPTLRRFGGICLVSDAQWLIH